MPHQLRLGLRAAHDLLELGQKRLRGRLVTELQINEDLVRLGDAAAHPVGLHALLGPETLVLVEVRLPGAEVPAGVLDVDVARQVLPPSLLASGVVYDVNTGLIEVVVPPRQ